MKPMGRLVVNAVVVVTVFLGATPVWALQEFPPVRWQLAPNCNIVTLTVVEEGPAYTLAGFDDNCGGSHSAAFGTVSLNPDGTFAMGLTVVTQGGRPDHFDIVLNASTISGTWQDAAGNSGDFLIDPTSPAAGVPRGAPPAVPTGTTLRGSYLVDFTAAGANARGTSAFSFGFTLPSAPATNFIAAGGASTAACPGTAAIPQAAPGQLCVYERTNTNVSFLCIAATGSTYLCGLADPYGASVFIESTAAGTTKSAGSWAVTVP